MSVSILVPHVPEVPDLFENGINESDEPTSPVFLSGGIGSKIIVLFDGELFGDTAFEEMIPSDIVLSCNNML